CGACYIYQNNDPYNAHQIDCTSGTPVLSWWQKVQAFFKAHIWLLYAIIAFVIIVMLLLVFHTLAGHSTPELPPYPRSLNLFIWVREISRRDISFLYFTFMKYKKI